MTRYSASRDILYTAPPPAEEPSEERVESEHEAEPTPADD